MRGPLPSLIRTSSWDNFTVLQRGEGELKAWGEMADPSALLFIQRHIKIRCTGFWVIRWVCFVNLCIFITHLIPLFWQYNGSGKNRPTITLTFLVCTVHTGDLCTCLAFSLLGDSMFIAVVTSRPPHITVARPWHRDFIASWPWRKLTQI